MADSQPLPVRARQNNICVHSQIDSRPSADKRYGVVGLKAVGAKTRSHQIKLTRIGRFRNVGDEKESLIAASIDDQRKEMLVIRGFIRRLRDCW